MNQVKRRNSEDFDMDLMEENTNIINQNANSRGFHKVDSIVTYLENTEGVITSINSKPVSIALIVYNTRRIWYLILEMSRRVTLEIIVSIQTSLW